MRTVSEMKELCKVKKNQIDVKCNLTLYCVLCCVVLCCVLVCCDVLYDVLCCIVLCCDVLYDVWCVVLCYACCPHVYDSMITCLRYICKFANNQKLSLSVM